MQLCLLILTSHSNAPFSLFVHYPSISFAFKTLPLWRRNLSGDQLCQPGRLLLKRLLVNCLGERTQAVPFPIREASLASAVTVAPVLEATRVLFALKALVLALLRRRFVVWGAYLTTIPSELGLPKRLPHARRSAASRRTPEALLLVRLVSFKGSVT